VGFTPVGVRVPPFRTSKIKDSEDRIRSSDLFLKTKNKSFTNPRVKNKKDELAAPRILKHTSYLRFVQTKL